MPVPDARTRSRFGWRTGLGQFLGALSAALLWADTAAAQNPMINPSHVQLSPCWQQLKQDGDGTAAPACAGAALEQADRDLNRAYRDVIDGIDPNWPMAAEYVQALKVAQRAWIVFRDAECDRVAVAVRGDANLWITSCLEYQTRRRVLELQAY